MRSDVSQKQVKQFSSNKQSEWQESEWYYEEVPLHFNLLENLFPKGRPVVSEAQPIPNLLMKLTEVPEKSSYETYILPKKEEI